MSQLPHTELSCRRAAFWLLAFALGSAACAFTPPTPQKGEVTPECRTRCQSNHDRCVLDAKTGEAIQTCDTDEKWCVSHCGP